MFFKKNTVTRVYAAPRASEVEFRQGRSFVAFAALSLFLACSKAEVAPSEGTVTPSVDPAVNPGIPEVVTLSATLEDLTTKVGFLPVYDTDGKTLSQLASTTLGWSSDIWDFTGDLPTLK